MALIKCNECGHEVSDKASVCPNCGNPMQKSRDAAVEEHAHSQQSKQRKGKWAIAAILLCVLAGGVYFAFTSKSLNENNPDNSSIVTLTPEFVESIEKYDELGEYSEGMAPVRKGEKWGYIDTKGNELIPCKYDEASRFSEGVAAVSQNGKWGYINTNGETVIPISLEAVYAHVFKEGLAFVYNDVTTFSFIDKDGKEVYSGEMDGMLYEGEGGSVIIDNLPFYNDGTVYVPLANDSEINMVQYDKQGNVIKEIEGTSVPDVVNQYEIINESGKFGLKDNKGNIIVPAKYDLVGTNSYNNVTVSNGVVLVGLFEYKKDGEQIIHYGYVDLDGNDTFTSELKSQCEQSLHYAYESEEYDDIPDYEEHSSTSISNEGERIVTIYIKGEKNMDDYSSLEGNYAAHNYKNAEDRIWSDAIRVPQGKVWMFKDCKKHATASIVFTAGFLEERDASYIIQYGNNNSANQAPTWKDVNNMNGERYYGGKVIRLLCELGRAFNGPVSFGLEVSFIEKDD